MKFVNCIYGLVQKAYHHLDRLFNEEDLMPERTHRLLRNGMHAGLDRPYENGRKSIFMRREEKPPKVWVDREYSISDILLEAAKQVYSAREDEDGKIIDAARQAYSGKDEKGRYRYSISELRGKHLSDYGLRKIASELNLELRATRVSEEEKQHIVDVYNNLMLNEERVTNDVLERLIHRNIGTIYRALHSAESEVKWKQKKKDEYLAEVIPIDRAAA